MKELRFLVKLKNYILGIIINFWYQKSLHCFFLLFYPLELIYNYIFNLKKIFYKYRFFKTYNFNIPIIVIGNLTVGGTGKTPMTHYLAKYLIEHGFKPAVIMRGYKSNHKYTSYIVPKNSDPKIFGDEPAILANNLDCPVAIGINRVKSVKLLIEQYNPNIIISDDGLQHYALGRDLEILMIDETLNFGNLHQLPLGPLREDLNKLNHVDFIIIKKKINHKNSISEKSFLDIIDAKFKKRKLTSIRNLKAKINYLHLIPEKIYNLKIEGKTLDPLEFSLVHAVAGIGNNENFFELLNYLGIKTINHKFPDHYNYNCSDFNFNDDLPIIMTEKDAIKCKHFAKNNFWYLKIKPEIELSQELQKHLNTLYKEKQ